MGNGLGWAQNRAAIQRRKAAQVCPVWWRLFSVDMRNADRLHRKYRNLPATVCESEMETVDTFVF